MHTTHFDPDALCRDLLPKLAPQPGHDLPRSAWDEDERCDRRPQTATIQVLLVRPDERPDLVTIPNELSAMQGLVGGTITTFDTGVPGTIGVANDEALLLRMPPNRFVPATGALIFGPLFLAGDGVNFHSLSAGELRDALAVFASPLTREQVQLALRPRNGTPGAVEVDEDG